MCVGTLQLNNLLILAFHIYLNWPHDCYLREILTTYSLESSAQSARAVPRAGSTVVADDPDIVFDNRFERCRILFRYIRLLLTQFQHCIVTVICDITKAQRSSPLAICVLSPHSSSSTLKNIVSIKVVKTGQTACKLVGARARCRSVESVAAGPAAQDLRKIPLSQSTNLSKHRSHHFNFQLSICIFKSICPWVLEGKRSERSGQTFPIFHHPGQNIQPSGFSAW